MRKEKGAGGWGLFLSTYLPESHRSMLPLTWDGEGDQSDEILESLDLMPVYVCMQVGTWVHG